MIDPSVSIKARTNRKAVNQLPGWNFDSMPKGWGANTATLNNNLLASAGPGGRVVSSLIPTPLMGKSVVYAVDAAPGNVGTMTLTIYDATAQAKRAELPIVMNGRNTYHLRYDSWVPGNAGWFYVYAKDTGSAVGGETINLYRADVEIVDGQPNPSFSEIGAGTRYFGYTPSWIACWGDSLSTNWMPSALRREFLATGRDVWVWDGGEGGDTSTTIKARMLARPDHFSDIAVIWAGRNNYQQPATVKADIDGMVSALGHNRFVVLSVLNGNYPTEYAGGADYATIMQLNHDLRATYPQNYVDVRSPLVAAYDPSQPQDVIDHGNDITPSSLRVDSVHLTPFVGYRIVADLIQNFIDAKGWSVAPVDIPYTLLAGV